MCSTLNARENNIVPPSFGANLDPQNQRLLLSANVVRTSTSEGGDTGGNICEPFRSQYFRGLFLHYVFSLIRAKAVLQDEHIVGAAQHMDALPAAVVLFRLLEVEPSYLQRRRLRRIQTLCVSKNMKGCLVLFFTNFMALMIKAEVADKDSTGSFIYAVVLIMAIMFFLSIWWNAWATIKAMFSRGRFQV